MSFSRSEPRTRASTPVRWMSIETSVEHFAVPIIGLRAALGRMQLSVVLRRDEFQVAIIKIDSVVKRLHRQPLIFTMRTNVVVFESKTGDAVRRQSSRNRVHRV